MSIHLIVEHDYFLSVGSDTAVVNKFDLFEKLHYYYDNLKLSNFRQFGG